MIKYVHQIDILIDLIALGHGGNLSLISKKPAPIIINYLGYPNFAHLPVYDYRIVDEITDPLSRDIPSNTEKLLRMPRCFLCYSLFENVVLPQLDVATSTYVRLGVMNKRVKWHTEVVNAWCNILEMYPNTVLCVKLEPNETQIHHTLLSSIPKHRMRLLPFSDTLDGYLTLFSEIDINLDTFPYSGTTTTCSACVMGIPTVTIYDPSRPHVSNVSASILHVCSESFERYVATNVDEYCKKLGTFIEHYVTEERSLEAKQARRSRFLKAMDGSQFMREFEQLLLSTL